MRESRGISVLRYLGEFCFSFFFWLSLGCTSGVLLERSNDEVAAVDTCRVCTREPDRGELRQIKKEGYQDCGFPPLLHGIVPPSGHLESVLASTIRFEG
jgi:hypothetical protein